MDEKEELTYMEYLIEEVDTEIRYEKEDVIRKYVKLLILENENDIKLINEINKKIDERSEELNKLENLELDEAYEIIQTKSENEVLFENGWAKQFLCKNGL